MIYVWHNQQVIEVPDWDDPAIQDKYFRVFVYSTEEDWNLNYVHRDGSWSPRNFQDIPKEFQLALLLLGVS